MGYPSLLYLVQPKFKPMSLTVFEDLQLFHFIPRSVAKTIRIPCEKDNLIPRQQLFSVLTEEAPRQKLTALYEIAEELSVLDGVASAPRCEAERLAVFAALADADRRFAALAAGAGFGDPLSDRFAACFAARRKEADYRAMEQELDALLPLLTQLSENAVSIYRGEIRVRDLKTETYVSRILSCADRLGVGAPRLRKPENRRLSPDLLTAAAGRHPDLTAALKRFYETYSGLYSPSVTYYRKELQFYLTMLSFFDRIREAGIPLTFPEVSGTRGLSVTEAYDVSLLAKEEKRIVPNDIFFTEEEPFFFLTGANGGGKTTYLRAVGIAALLFANGCPLPCRAASIGEISGIFTHFPRDERFDGSGRFVEENRRVEAILSEIDEKSLVLLNETYATTNEENAILMTEKLAGELNRRRTLGLYITHQHALSDTGIPYLNVLIDRNDANRRTFRIARQKSTGGSYARDILEKCGLTREALEKRFGALPEKEETP